MKDLGISRSQINRKINTSKTIIRSLDCKGQYLAHITYIQKRAFQSGVALINNHIFSTENDIIPAMLKCIRESKWGRTRESLERMFRCSDLGKSFKKLEQIEDIVTIKLGKKFLYLWKDKKEEQLKNYYHKKGIQLREKEKQYIKSHSLE